MDQDWDVVIIGTGMGGSTLGYALAQKGKKVLFLERGLAYPSDQSIIGKSIESTLDRCRLLGGGDSLLHRRGGRYSRSLTDITHPNHPYSFIPFMGEGIGGSSSIYGAALERFFPEDFQATRFFSAVPGASVVDWPIGYTDLADYNEKAEELYQVCGSPDPLRLDSQSKKLRIAPLSRMGEKISTHWKSKGLHPYHLPLGHKPNPHAKCPGCQGFLCQFSEKMGAAEACLIPAITNHGAVLITDCDAQEIVADSQRVHTVKCLWQGKQVSFHGKIIVLAAGALNTPRLLLRSTSSYWPNGLANSSNLVGKNLCRHFLDLYTVKLDSASNDYSLKELALNDFYFSKGNKLGTVQSLGNIPDPRAGMCGFLSQLASYSPWFKNSIITSLVNTFGEKAFRYLLSGFNVASIMEDVSYPDNQVSLSKDRETINIHYKLRPEAVQRLTLFRSLILDSLRPYSTRLHKQAENNLRLAHVSGTCRMGHSSSTSVVNPNNKAHELENLYIVDSSFFPSSSGTNPALTIAANALRVAEVIAPTQ
jgi:choline dehydrogenase-like flavoprotein